MLNDSPKIGKDVIESLTLGMYEDCRFIYREYIQNSADQIDRAKSVGLLEQGEDEIFVTINPENGTIEIEDNATGIAAKDVLPILRNVAHSTKKRGENKGFRGIGRLGGLGYCSKLIFETSYEGEDVCSIMTWDADLLKSIINDRNNSEEATEVIDKVTTITTRNGQRDRHYFKVTLEGVKSPVLLNIEEVKNYLSMVAPVDISSNFMFRTKINNFVKEHDLHVDVYNIYVNGEQIYKPYTNYIYEDNHGGKKKVDDILDVDFFLRNDSENKLMYWGWYSLSRLNGQMKAKNLARGIRLRKENIQIGDEEICKKFFANTSDQRFSFYYFGEIHAVSKDLIPNSRRDYFGENDALSKFESLVRQDFMKLRDMCYDASGIKKSLKTIAQKEELESKIKHKEETGYASPNEHKDLKKQLAELQKKSDEAHRDLEKRSSKLDQNKSPLKRIIDNLVPARKNSDEEVKGLPPMYPPSSISENPDSQNYDTTKNNDTSSKPKYITDKPIYSRFSRQEKKLIGKIFSDIEKAMPNEGMREALIKFIEEDLTK